MTHVHDSGGVAVCFPAEPQERRAHEGPFAEALIVHAMHAGARYELARFDLPKALSTDKRRELMTRIERGMSGRPDVEKVEVGTVVTDGHVARALSMRLQNQRIGKWLLYFPTPQRMLQVSVVGPMAARTDAERFLATIGGCQN